MSLKIFILSPHFDDAAYGLTLHISGFIKSGLPLTIVNCFTITRWTSSIPESENAIEVTPRRATRKDARDDRLSDQMIRFVNLNLLDGDLRDGHIFRYRPFNLNEWVVIHRLQQKLENLIIESDGILLCPIGIGRHIDHAICLEAISELYHGLKVLFYEDAPLMTSVSTGKINIQVKTLEERLGITLEPHRCSIHDPDVNKEIAIRIYESQMNDNRRDEITSHMQNISAECIWGEASVIDELNSNLK